MKGKFLLVKIGAVAEAALLTFTEHFFSELGENVADGVYKHRNVDVHVRSTMPQNAPRDYLVIWRDQTGVWWMQSYHGRWYWSIQGWYPA